MTKEERRKLALGLFIESVIKPDSDLRGQAHEQQCFYELMEIRDEILNHLYSLKHDA
jgi:hypothetical protein